MSIALLEAAQALVAAERATKAASRRQREAHSRCETHSRGYCRSSECVDAENALYAAVRDELEAHKVALAELRKLAESNAVAAPPRDKTVLFDGEFRPSAEWQELAEKTR